MIFRLSDTLAGRLETLIDTRLLVQANSGGGKSWCIRRLLEQTHGHVQHLVIDPEGEFASLRERFDYVLAARQGGDTGVDPRTAKLLAERLLELGVSAILDIYELKAHERIRFVRHFLEALVDAPKKLWHPALVVVDEAHVFCPQKGDAESAGAVIDLATRGRKRGFCAVLATQRLSKLHKDAAAECNNKLIGRTGLDVDVQRAADELGLAKARWTELRDLEPGEFFAFGPALSREVGKARIGPVQTTHPKAGSRLATIAPAPTAKIRALLPKLADLPAEVEQKAKTEAELRKELAELRRHKCAVSMPAPKPVEIPVVLPQDRELLERSLRMWWDHKEAAANLVASVIEGLQSIDGRLATIQKQHATGPARVTGSAGVTRDPKTPASIRGGQHALSDRGERRRSAGDREGSVAGAALSGPEQRILDAIAWMESIGVRQPEQPAVAFLAGYKYGGGAFNNPRGRLNARHLVFYRPGERIELTDDGRQLAHFPDSALTPEELHRRVLERLPGPEQRLLRPLLEAYPKELSNEDLAAAAGYTPNAGAFNNPRGRLRSLGLIAYPRPGAVVARSLLFLEEGS